MNAHWTSQPNRVLLINLREGDEPQIDPAALIAEVKRFGATAFCINGGGIVAFYQTHIAEHRVSSGLGERDLLAEIVPAAHEAGLHVLARIDPSCAPQGARSDTSRLVCARSVRRASAKCPSITSRARTPATTTTAWPKSCAKC